MSGRELLPRAHDFFRGGAPHGGRSSHPARASLFSCTRTSSLTPSRAPSRRRASIIEKGRARALFCCARRRSSSSGGAAGAGSSRPAAGVARAWARPGAPAVRVGRSRAGCVCGAVRMRPDRDARSEGRDLLRAGDYRASIFCDILLEGALCVFFEQQGRFARRAREIGVSAVLSRQRAPPPQGAARAFWDALSLIVPSADISSKFILLYAAT